MVEPAAPNHSPQKSFLLVDDDLDVLKFVSLLIGQKIPYAVYCCRTAMQALKAASQLSLQLLILDYQLPDISGLALHDRLQTFAHLQDVPAIMMSAYEQPVGELQRRHICFLCKPFQVSRLLAGIEVALA